MTGETSVPTSAVRRCVIVLVVSLLVCSMVGAAAATLYDFEGDASGTSPDNFTQRSNGHGTVTVINSDAYEGSQSISIDESSDGDSTYLYPSDQPFDSLRTKPVSIWMKHERTDAGASFGAIRLDTAYKNKKNAKGPTVRLNATHLWTRNGSRKRVATSNLTSGTWVYVRIHSINAEGETAALEWKTENGQSGTADDIGALNGIDDGGYNKTFILANEGEYRFDNFDTNAVSSQVSSDADISGTVRDQEGDPVGGATVKLYAVDHNSLSGPISEKREQAREITQEISSVGSVDEFPGNISVGDGSAHIDPEKSLTDRFGADSADDIVGGVVAQPYVAVHSTDDWGFPPQYEVYASGIKLRNAQSYDDPRLGFNSPRPGPFGPSNAAPAGEPLILSVWEPRTGLGSTSFQTGLDRQLPGRASGTETEIVIKRLSPRGKGIINERTVSTFETFDTTSPLDDNAAYGVASLSTGFYIVHPKDHPESAYTLRVGDTESYLGSIYEDLETERGTVAQQVENLRDFRNNNTVTDVTVTTDSNGRFNHSFNSKTLNTVKIVAYKKPGGVNIDPQNVTRSDIRDYYNELDIESLSQSELPDSTFVAKPRTADVPAKNITITGRSFSVDPAANQSVAEDLRAKIQDLLDDIGVSNLHGVLRQQALQLQELDRADLREYYQDLQRAVEDNPSLLTQAKENLNRKQGSSEANELLQNESDLNRTQLENRLDAIQETLEESQPTVDSGDTETDIGSDTISTSWTVDDDLTSEDVLVRVEWANGTLEPVPEEYITVDDSLASGTTVTVEQFPVGANDPGTLQFDFKAITENGVAKETTDTIRNPQFSGQIPGLDAVRLSSLRPQTGEQFVVEARPGDAENFGGVQDIDIRGPTGKKFATGSPSNNAENTTLNETGEYMVRVEYANPGGQTFVKTFRVDAVDRSTNRPPTVRAKSGPTGAYALVSDGVEAGSIEASSATGTLDVVAQLPTDSDARQVHVYTGGVEQGVESRTEVQIVQGDDRQSVTDRFGVTVHAPSIDGGDAEGHVYRVADGDHQPLPRDGGEWGSITVSSDKTLIQTVTNEQGSLTVESDANPTLFERVVYDIQLRVPDISVPVGMAAGGIAVPVVGLGVVAGKRRGGA